MNALTRVSADGSVAIPADMRARLGLKADTPLEIIEGAGELTLRPQLNSVITDDALLAFHSKLPKYNGPPVTLQDMEDAINAAMQERWDRKIKP